MRPREGECDSLSFSRLNYKWSQCLGAHHSFSVYTFKMCATVFALLHSLPLSRSPSLSLCHSAFSISNFPNIIICRVAFCFAASLLMLLRKDAFVYNNDKQLDFPRSSNAILIIYLVVTTHFRPENLEHPFYTPIQNIHRISTLNVYTFFLSFCCC